MINNNAEESGILESDFYEIIQDALLNCHKITSSPDYSQSEKWAADNCCEILLMYFINHEDNKFAKACYNILPRCSEITVKDRKIAIEIMAKKIFNSSKELIRYYGSLAYLHYGLPWTLENYEHTLETFFLAVTWKRERKPQHIVEGMCITDGDFSAGFDDEEVKYLQYSYLALCKWVYLPFLYGYDMSSVINCRIYPRVKEHLTKVRYKEIDTKSDIHEIIDAVFNLAKFINTSETPNSVYLDKKVDQYILLSQSATIEMIKLK